MTKTRMGAFLLLLLITSITSAFGQFYIPPDSIYQPGIAICTFRSETIDPNYFCQHPWPPYQYSTSGGGGSTAGFTITPTAQLVTNPSVLNVLTTAHATLEPLWPACSNPCVHRSEVTQWGDTLSFPYWTQYLVHFPDSISPVALSYWMMYANYNAVEAMQPLRQDPSSYASNRAITNDPKYATDQLSLVIPPAAGTGNWGINVDSAWNITTGNWSVKMAVLDEGFDDRHQDYHHVRGDLSLDSNTVQQVDFTGNGFPRANHGTFVSGIMGALRNNKDSSGNWVGMAGIAGGDWANGNRGCQLYLGVVNNDPNGNGPRLYTNLAIAYGKALSTWMSATDCNDSVRIFNMSFGNGNTINTIDASGGTWNEYKSLAQAYRRCGILVNAKTQLGWRQNTDPDQLNWKYDLPGGYNDEWIIQVGSGRIQDGRLAVWSGWGGNLRILAPGTNNVFSMKPDNKYAIWKPLDPTSPDGDLGGNSLATPHVSGTAALILSRDNTLLNDDVAGLMEATARKTGYFAGQVNRPDSIVNQTDRYDKHTGFGLLDAGAAVGRVPDVLRGFVDVKNFTEAEYQARVVVTPMDPAPSPNFLVAPTDPAVDPFPGTVAGFRYRWQRHKVEVTKIAVGGAGQRLDHAWGIGMGHNFVPNTKGWEGGAMYRAEDSLGNLVSQVRWCSETPYAKVDPASINDEARTFTAFTYCYKLLKIKDRTPNQSGDTAIIWYPVDPRECLISYGYLLSPLSSSVEGGEDVTSFSMVGVHPNPAQGERVTARFTTMRTDRYTVTISDILGHTITGPVDLGRIEPGTRDVPIDIQAFVPGVYLCRITAAKDGSSVVRSFTVIR